MVITDMGSDRYCLRWNNHQNNLLGVFSQLLQEESLVDVTLACSEGHSIRAHKVVLSACSSYFQSLFLDHPNRHPIIILKDVCFAELRTLVEFMYRGEVNLEYCQLPTFLKTAESLQVKGLAEMTHLPSTLSPERELPAARDGQHASRDELQQHPSTVIAAAAATVVTSLEPLPLICRRSRSPSDTDASDKGTASPPQPPQIKQEPLQEMQPLQLSPRNAAAPTASPPRSATAAAPSTPAATTHRHHIRPSLLPGRMSVSPPPPDMCSPSDDDRSTSPDMDDDVSSIHSGPSDITHTSSQISSPQCLKVIPGSSNFFPIQSAPLDLITKEPNSSDCDKNDDRSSVGNNSEYSISNRHHQQDGDLFERQAMYTCPYCGAAFPHQSKLTRHILSHSLETLKYREQSQSQTNVVPPPPHLSIFPSAHHPVACTAAVACIPASIATSGAIPITSTTVSIVASAALESSSSCRGADALGGAICGSGAGAGCLGISSVSEWNPLRSPLVELPQPHDIQQAHMEAAAAAAATIESPGAVCKFCGKAFPDVGALIGHLPAHTGDRPFKCEFCGKAFKLRHHMKDHCRVHTGERPFRCSLCGKTFSRSTILKAHEKTHYPKYVRKFLSPSPEEEHRPPEIPLPCDLSMAENSVEASTSTPPMYIHRPTPSPSP